MAVGFFARVAGRAAVTAGRYALGLARSRGGRILGGVVIAERVTRPVRFGYGLSRAYAHVIESRSRGTSDSSPQRRRGAAFEYVYKY